MNETPSAGDDAVVEAELERSTSTRSRPAWWIAVLGGVISALVALGVAELIAGLNRSWRSPVLDVGDRVIDAAPPWLKEFAIDRFGTNDKQALLIGIGTLLAAYAAVIGFFALRRAFVVGVVGIALFGVIGAWASLSRRGEAPWHAALPSIIGAAAGIGALWLLHQSLQSRDRSAATGEGTGRRAFLAHTGTVLGGLAAGAAAVGAIGRLLGNRFSAAESRSDVALPTAAEPIGELPAATQVDVPGMTPFVTPNDAFYRIDTALTAPQVPTEGYTLRVIGMVDNELELSYDDLLGRALIERDVTLTCVSNEIGGRLVGNARWLGTLLAPLLEEAGVQPGADQLVGRSFDGFECGFPTAVAMDGRDAMVVFGMNGEPLPIEHGFPVRLVVPGLYGYVSATKWLTELELTTFAEFDHYWLRRGWAQQAPIKLMSRIDTPKGLAKVPAGVVPVAGVAWAQTVGISAVEVNVDDTGWQPAELGEVTTNDTWRQWVYRWDAQPGRHTLVVRAIDNNGAIQTAERAEPIPDGASGLHQIVVTVE